MKYEEPKMQVIKLLSRDVFMTDSVGGIVTNPSGEGGEDEF